MPASDPSVNASRCSAAATLLHLAERTLRQWRANHLHIELATALPLGRPTLRSSRSDRMAALAVLDELGPATSVATLRECCPILPRAEVADLVHRYRRIWRHRHRAALHVLRWTVPGAVWAIDFAQSPQPIDGVFPYLLAVRDLASGLQLAWQPVTALTAHVARLTLTPLFLAHGAPLVLKIDNGSAFRADDFLAFLGQFGVTALFSPAYTPQYNGAIEAGIGSLKTRTERHATYHGRPNAWNADDLAAAQTEANAMARPHGPTGPTPDQFWHAHTPPTPQQRDRFHATLSQRRIAVYATEGIPADGSASAQDARRLDRQAIRQALVELDYLLFRRRLIPLPLMPRKRQPLRRGRSW